jgi:hypothetical protein
VKEPVDHILRPCLPWRDTAAVTECGYDATKVSTITRDDFAARVKDLGYRRTAMLTCMTCAETVQRWATWEEDPRQAIGREIEWERGHWSRTKTDRGQRLLDELTVIEQLIAAHRDEFDQSIAEIEGRRAWNEKKAAMTQPKPRDRRTL